MPEARSLDELTTIVEIVNSSATLTAAAEILSTRLGRTVTRATLGRDCRRLRADGWDIRLFPGRRFPRRPGPPVTPCH